MRDEYYMGGGVYMYIMGKNGKKEYNIIRTSICSCIIVYTLYIIKRPGLIPVNAITRCCGGVNKYINKIG